jgi:hypothetical protein
MVGGSAASDDDDTKSQSAGAIKIIGSELFSIGGKGASEISLRQNNASGACNVIICSESFDVAIAARESIDSDSVAMPAF